MGKKLKIAMVISNMSIGGAQKAVIDIVKEMNLREDLEVKIFVHDRQNENHFSKVIAQNNIQVEYITKDKRISFRNYYRLSSALNGFKPDVVHIHLDTFYTPIWTLLNHKKTIFTIHSQAHRIFLKRIHKLIFKLLIHKNYFVFTSVSEKIAKEVEKLFGISEKKIKSIGNPVTIPAYYKRKNTEQVSFINVARFHPVKNHKLLIKAFARVVKEYPNSMLNLVGDGERIQECRQLVKNLNLEDKIIFWGNCSNIYAMLKEADVFVLSSDSEAMPISILEAMACSLPIIATNVGGVSEMISGNGILVQKNSLDELEEAMKRMIHDQDLRENYSKASYHLVKKFDVSNIVDQYIELYR